MAAGQPAWHPENFVSKDEVRTYYATKADIAQLESKLIKWLIGAVLSSATLAAALVSVIVRLID